MATTIFIPSVFRMDAIDKFTRDIVDSDGKPIDKNFSFDFSRLSFIDGSGLTVLNNTIAWIKDNNCRLEIVSNSNTSDGIRYLDDCGFFGLHLKKKIFFDSKPRKTTLPCVSVSNANSFSWIENNLSPWLEWVLYTSNSSLGSIRACMKELFNNILDHSHKNTGFIHAQHYPTSHNIKITVSDFGVGIPHTITQSFGPMNDAQAIFHAAKEGVTSQSRPNNMGAGLNFLIDCITSNDGTVTVHSRRGHLFCRRYRGNQERNPRLTKGSYPGTLVEISLDTRMFQGDDDERGELEW
jgi:hypothetical protein